MTNEMLLRTAIKEFTKAIELKPDFYEAYYKRGYAKYRLGEYDGAIADLTKTVEIKPDYFKAYYWRGKAKMKKGDIAKTKEEKRKWYNDALVDFDEAIEL